MRIVKNEKYIQRNSKIGLWCSNIGLLLVLVPMFFYVQAMMGSDVEALNFTLFAPTVIGVVLSQIGVYLGNRFGRSPRTDERLDAGLKGLPGEFTLYHYSTPVSHLLVGPAGLWVLLPYFQRGDVSYSNNRWRMAGGGALQKYMRVFGQESLGRPELDAEGEIQSLRKHLQKQLTDEQLPTVRAALVFTSDDVRINADGAPLPALKLKQLKDFIRQRSKERSVDSLTLEKIREAL